MRGKEKGKKRGEYGKDHTANAVLLLSTPET
jgi:hypothetical protein